jgi:hypothetical protein
MTTKRRATTKAIHLANKYDETCFIYPRSNSSIIE